MTLHKVYLHISPPWYVFHGDGQLRQADIQLGPAYLARAAVKAGWAPVVFNGDLESLGSQEIEVWGSERGVFENMVNDEHPGWRSLRQILRDAKPDVAGITALTPSYLSALKTARIVKEECPECKVIVGGAHASALPAEVAAEDNIDAAVFGEGENTLIDLLNHWRRSSAPPAGIPGVAAKRDGQVSIGPPRKLVANLDDLGWPNKGASYDSHGYIKQDNYGRVAHSRGCPFQCTFCGSSSIWSRKIRWRSAKDMVAEMIALYKEYDTRFFSFQDDTFTMDRVRTFDFLDQLIASGLPEIPGFRWHCYTRPELVEVTMLEKMKQAGLAAMAIGIESGNGRILKKMKKRYTTDDARRGVRLIKEEGLLISGLFMVGLPTETEAEMWDTVHLAEELECEAVTLSVATPLPATSLYDEAIGLGLLPKEGIDWAAVTNNNDGVLMTIEKDGCHLPMPREERKRILGEIQGAFEVIEAKAGDAKLRSRLKYESQYIPPD